MTESECPEMLPGIVQFISTCFAFGNLITMGVGWRLYHCNVLIATFKNMVFWILLQEAKQKEQ